MIIIAFKYNSSIIILHLFHVLGPYYSVPVNLNALQRDTHLSIRTSKSDTGYE